MSGFGRKKSVMFTVKKGKGGRLSVVQCIRHPDKGMIYRSTKRKVSGKCYKKESDARKAMLRLKGSKTKSIKRKTSRKSSTKKIDYFVALPDVEKGGIEAKKWKVYKCKTIKWDGQKLRVVSVGRQEGQRWVALPELAKCRRTGAKAREDAIKYTALRDISTTGFNMDMVVPNYLVTGSSPLIPGMPFNIGGSMSTMEHSRPQVPSRSSMANKAYMSEFFKRCNVKFT